MQLSQSTVIMGAMFIKPLQTILNRSGGGSFYYSSRATVFLVDLAIGLVIFYLIHLLRGSILWGKLSYLLVLLIGVVNMAVLNQQQGVQPLWPGLLIDHLVVVVSAVLAAFPTTLPRRIAGNLVFLVLLLPLTFYLLFRHGLLINGVPVVIGMLLITSFDYYTRRSRLEQQALIVTEKQDSEFRIVSHIAHGVKPQLLIARTPLETVIRHLEQQGTLQQQLPGKLLDGSHETVGDALHKTLQSLNQISDVVANARQLVGREISPEDFEEVDLGELFLKEIVPPYHTKEYRIEVYSQVRNPLRLHRASFVEAINNLIRNAEVHGFSDTCTRRNKVITFRLKENVKAVTLDYTNNGLPFPANLTERDFLTFGTKSHDSPGEGLGGAWIGKVIEAHHGSFQIIRDKHPLHFRITLPKRI